MSSATPPAPTPSRPPSMAPRPSAEHCEEGDVDAALQERLKSEMAWEFARTGPPEGFPKFPDIPGGRYTSDEFFEVERTQLWTKVWVMAGRAEDVAGPGDYMTFDDLGL